MGKRLEAVHWSPAYATRWAVVVDQNRKGALDQLELSVQQVVGAVIDLRRIFVVVQVVVPVQLGYENGESCRCGSLVQSLDLLSNRRRSEFHADRPRAVPVDA